MNALAGWIGAERDRSRMNEGGPGLALSRSSGGSRAANADDGAPRKHAAFHSSRRPDRKAPAAHAASSRRRLGLTRPGRISGDGLACADVPRDHAAGPDNRPVTNRHARQDNGAAPDPDIAADSHRTPELNAAAPGLGIAGMVGGVDLRRRSDLRSIADGHFDDIKDDAIEIQENFIAETDVIAKVAEERRADHGARADMTETLGQQRVALRHGQRQRRVVAHQPGFVRSLIGGYFGIAGTIKFAREHLLLFGFGQPMTPSFGNALGTAASAARARALSSSICRTSASTLSNFNSSRMKAMKAVSSAAP